MERNEQDIIDDLFSHLAEVERSSGPRDTEAERYINQLIASQPAAVYFMTQSLIVQEHALKAAQERIEELEREAEARAGSGRGSFLGGLFGGGGGSGSGSRSSVPSSGSVPSAGGGFRYPQQGAPMDQQPPARYQEPASAPEPRGSGGGGFLTGVMQTAAGVAGGVVLGNMITGMFSGHGNSAQAAPQPWTAPQEASHHAAPEPAPDTAAHEDQAGYTETSGFDDFGGDFDIDV